MFISLHLEFYFKIEYLSWWAKKNWRKKLLPSYDEGQRFFL